MIVVIFKATLRELDESYGPTAARMRHLALEEFGCVEFVSVCEGGTEISLSYWNDEAQIQAWRAHPEHRAAQEMGQSRWYASYTVEVARIERSYSR